MTETDPYSAPQTDVYANRLITEKLQGLDFKQLKKLYYRSCNVNAITFLVGLGFIVLAIVLVLPNADYEPIMKYVFVALAVFYSVAVVGLFQRTSWGRILGIIVCIISLINIPLGTAVGVFGLFAFFGAPELFGPNRITHRELKSEFKLQKAQLKKG
jgi:FtsH-binding integral membrane protein